MVNMLKCQNLRCFAQRICDYRNLSITQGVSGGALQRACIGASCFENLKVGEPRNFSVRSGLPTAETSSVTSQSVLEAVEQRLGPLSKAPSLPPPPPVVIVISGPSGVGKDAVIKALQESRPDLHFVVTATSRPQRPGEVHGVDYLFVTREEFEAWIEGGQLLEHALVYGEYKGIPRQQVVDALSRGTDVVLRLDIQGAATVRRLIPSAVSIFLVANSEEELVKRLIDRKTEPLDKMLVRVETARQETLHIHEFDYVVVNQDRELDTAVRQIQGIISTEKLRVSRLLSQSPPGATSLANQ